MESIVLKAKHFEDVSWVEDSKHPIVRAITEMYPEITRISEGVDIVTFGTGQWQKEYTYKEYIQSTLAVDLDHIRKKNLTGEDVVRVIKILNK